MSVVISITQGDLLDVDADVLALKFAQGFHSSDGLVANRLHERGVNKRTLEALENEVKRVASQGAVRAREVLFVGTVSLRKFGTTTCGSSRPARWKRSASRRRRSRSRCMARTAGSTKKKRCWRTVLLVRDVNELQFDVKAHRCIVYSSIKDLEAKLKAELATL